MYLFYKKISRCVFFFESSRMLNLSPYPLPNPIMVRLLCLDSRLWPKCPSSFLLFNLSSNLWFLSLTWIYSVCVHIFCWYTFLELPQKKKKKNLLLSTTAMTWLTYVHFRFRFHFRFHFYSRPCSTSAKILSFAATGELPLPLTSATASASLIKVYGWFSKRVTEATLDDFF